MGFLSVSVLETASVPATAFAFVFVAITLLCFTRFLSKTGQDEIGRYRVGVLGFTLLLISSHVAQIVSYIVKAVVREGWFAPHYAVLYGMLSILFWGVSLILLYDVSLLTWHPFVTAWSMSASFEIAIAAAIRSASFDEPVDLKTLSFALSIARVFVFAGLLLWFFLSRRMQCKTAKHKGDSEQAKPLLASSDAVSDEGYGSVNSDATGNGQQNDSSASSDTGLTQAERDKEILKEQQRKRFHDAGGSWGYLKGFKVFLPHLIPKNNRTVQLHLIVIAVCLGAGRAMTILIPRQVGIITDTLTISQTTHYFPWREVLIWGAFRWTQTTLTPCIQNFSSDRVQQFGRIQLFNMAFSHVMSLSIDFHNDKNTGEVTKAVDQADSLCDLLQQVLFTILPIFLDMALAIWYLIYLFDAYFAIIFLFVGVTVIWSSTRVTAIQMPKRSAYNKEWRENYRLMVESISNWTTVAYFNRQEFEEQQYSKSLMSYIRTLRDLLNVIYLGSVIRGLTMTLGFLAAALMAAYRVSEGSKPVGSFVALIMLWGNITQPLLSLVGSYTYMARLMVDAERLLQLVRTQPSVTSSPDAPSINIKYGKVQFDHVSFAYDPRKMALEDINFTVDGGKTVAFVGETGGGKSTILNVLLRYYDTKEGSVRIDGQDVRDVDLDSLRECFGVVPQDPSMFNRSIMENIRYGRLDATDEEIYDACRAAAVHDKIMTFPEKYKSTVGERGVKLSGGELQRIAIARVFLKNPAIVVLDEATSAVDSATEKLIQESFRKLSTGRTTFVVAHRLSTIMDADLILVIDQGKIVERGTHEELLGRGGRYDELWSRQSIKTSDVRKSKTAELLVDTSDAPDPIAQLDGGSASKAACCTGDDDESQEDAAAGNKTRQCSLAEQTPLQMISPRPTEGVEGAQGQQQKKTTEVPKAQKK